MPLTLVSVPVEILPWLCNSSVARHQSSPRGYAAISPCHVPSRRELRLGSVGEDRLQATTRSSATAIADLANRNMMVSTAQDRCLSTHYEPASSFLRNA